MPVVGLVLVRAVFAGVDGRAVDDDLPFLTCGDAGRPLAVKDAEGVVRVPEEGEDSVVRDHDASKRQFTGGRLDVV